MKTRKFLAVLLSLAMTLSLLPVGVFATATYSEADLDIDVSIVDGAISSAGNGTKYYVLDNSKAADLVEAWATAEDEDAFNTALSTAYEGSIPEELPTSINFANDAGKTIVAVSGTTYDTMVLEDYYMASQKATVTAEKSDGDYGQTKLSSNGDGTKYYKLLDNEPTLNTIPETKSDATTAGYELLPDGGIVGATIDKYIVVLGIEAKTISSFGAVKITKDEVDYATTLANVTLTDAAKDPIEITQGLTAGTVSAPTTIALTAAANGLTSVNNVTVALTATDPTNVTINSVLQLESADAPADSAYDEQADASSPVDFGKGGAAQALYVRVQPNDPGADAAYYKITATLEDATQTLTGVTTQEFASTSGSHTTNAKTQDGTFPTMASTDSADPTTITAPVYVTRATNAVARVTLALANAYEETPSSITDGETKTTAVAYGTTKGSFENELTVADGATTASCEVASKDLAKTTYYIKVTTTKNTSSVLTERNTYYALTLNPIDNEGEAMVFAATFGNETTSVTEPTVSADEAAPTKIAVTLNKDTANSDKMSAMPVSFTYDELYTLTVFVGAKNNTNEGKSYQTYTANEKLDISAGAIYVKLTKGENNYYYEFDVTWTAGTNVNLSSVQVDSNTAVTSFADVPSTAIGKVTTPSTTAPTTFAGEIPVTINGTGEGSSVTVKTARSETDIAVTGVAVTEANYTAYVNDTDAETKATKFTALIGNEFVAANSGDVTEGFTFTGVDLKDNVLLLKVTAEDENTYAIYVVTVAASGTATLSGATIAAEKSVEYMFAKGAVVGTANGEATSPTLTLTLGGNFKFTAAAANNPKAYITFGSEFEETLGDGVDYTVAAVADQGATANITFSGTVKSTTSSATGLTMTIKSGALAGVNTDVVVTSKVSVSVVEATLAPKTGVPAAAGKLLVLANADFPTSDLLTLTLAGGSIDYAVDGSSHATAFQDTPSITLATGKKIVENDPTVTAKANATPASKAVSFALTGTVKAADSDTITATIPDEALKAENGDTKYVLVAAGDALTASVEVESKAVRVEPDNLTLIKGVTNTVTFKLTLPEGFDFKDKHATSGYNISTITGAGNQGNADWTVTQPQDGDYTDYVAADQENPEVLSSVTLTAKVTPETAGDYAASNITVPATAAGTVVTVPTPAIKVVNNAVTLDNINAAVLKGNNADFSLTLRAPDGLTFKTLDETTTPKASETYTVNVANQTTTVLTAYSVVPSDDGSMATLTVRYAKDNANEKLADKQITVTIGKAAFNEALNVESLTTVANANAKLTIDELVIGTTAITLVQDGNYTTSGTNNKETASFTTLNWANTKLATFAETQDDAGTEYDTLSEFSVALSTTPMDGKNVTRDVFLTTSDKVTTTASEAKKVNVKLALTSLDAIDPEGRHLYLADGNFEAKTSADATGSFDVTINPRSGLAATFTSDAGGQTMVTEITSGESVYLNIKGARGTDGELLPDGSYNVVVTNKVNAAETFTLNTQAFSGGNLTSAADVTTKALITKVLYGGEDSITPQERTLTVAIYATNDSTTALATGEVTLTTNPGKITGLAFAAANGASANVTGDDGLAGKKIHADYITGGRIIGNLYVTPIDAYGNVVYTDGDAKVIVKATPTDNGNNLGNGVTTGWLLNGAQTAVSGRYQSTGDHAGAYLFSDMQLTNLDAAVINGATLVFSAEDGTAVNADPEEGQEAVESLLGTQADVANRTLTFTVPKNASTATVNLKADNTFESNSNGTIKARDQLYVAIEDAKGYDGQFLTEGLQSNWRLVIVSDKAEDAPDYKATTDENKTLNKAAIKTLYGVDANHYIVAIETPTFNVTTDNAEPTPAITGNKATFTITDSTVGGPLWKSNTMGTTDDTFNGTGAHTLTYALYQVVHDNATDKDTVITKAAVTSESTSKSVTVNPGDAYKLEWSKATGFGQSDIKVDGDDTKTAKNLNKAVKIRVLDKDGNGTTGTVKVQKKTTTSDWTLGGTAIENGVDASSGVAQFAVGALTVQNNTSQQITDAVIQFYVADKITAGTENAVETAALTLGVGADQSGMKLIQPYADGYKQMTYESGAPIAIKVRNIKDIYGDAIITGEKEYDVTMKLQASDGSNEADLATGKLKIENGVGKLTLTEFGANVKAAGAKNLDVFKSDFKTVTYRAYTAANKYSESNAYITVTISGAAAKTLTLNNSTFTAKSGATIDPSFTATLKDSNGNVVTDESYWVGVTVSDDNSVATLKSTAATPVIVGGTTYLAIQNVAANTGAFNFNDLAIVNPDLDGIEATLTFTVLKKDADGKYAVVNTDTQGVTAAITTAATGTVDKTKSHAATTLTVTSPTGATAGSISAQIGTDAQGARDHQWAVVAGEKNVTFVLASKAKTYEFTEAANFTVSGGASSVSVSIGSTTEDAKSGLTLAKLPAGKYTVTLKMDEISNFIYTPTESKYEIAPDAFSATVKSNGAKFNANGAAIDGGEISISNVKLGDKPLAETVYSAEQVAITFTGVAAEQLTKTKYTLNELDENGKLTLALDGTKLNDEDALNLSWTINLAEQDDDAATAGQGTLTLNVAKAQQLTATIANVTLVKAANGGYEPCKVTAELELGDTTLDLTKYTVTIDNTDEYLNKDAYVLDADGKFTLDINATGIAAIEKDGKIELSYTVDLTTKDAAKVTATESQTFEVTEQTRLAAPTISYNNKSASFVFTTADTTAKIEYIALTEADLETLTTKQVNYKTATWDAIVNALKGESEELTATTGSVASGTELSMKKNAYIVYEAVVARTVMKDVPTSENTVYTTPTFAGVSVAMTKTGTEYYALTFDGDFDGYYVATIYSKDNVIKFTNTKVAGKIGTEIAVDANCDSVSFILFAGYADLSDPVSFGAPFVDAKNLKVDKTEGTCELEDYFE